MRYQQKQAEHWSKYTGERKKVDAQLIAELRTEVDGLAGRIKAELLNDLKIEIERLIVSAGRYQHYQISELPQNERNQYADKE
jgi:hypothetical protein